ncbi:MAG TPA: C45 family autoproteolytic acyltransferase/hydrolase [Spirochaetota bacterium]|nr:C45 family autoproteolytic acyltransferase/hydrolase [Spirochaetota bacterium]HPJ43493.1 C45 family autoproteolytic acyltransferase/hydrolase [Spirochaetota bacterium]
MFFMNRADYYTKKIISEGEVRKFRDGELSYSCGYPLLKLKGSYYSMGLQYGVLLRKEITRLYGRNNERKAEVMSALPWYMRPAGGLIMALVAGYSVLRVPRKYRRELTALSRGSGVAFMDIATTAFGGVVFDAACTSVLAGGKNGLLHAQNLDFEPAYLGEFPVIVEYHHPGKLRYMHLGIAGIPGIFHGMNEKGISVTVNYGDGTYNRANKGLPMGYKLREILERAESVDDVERILHETGPDELGWIVTVGSSCEKCGAVFDIFNGEIVRTEFSGKGSEFVLNNIFSPERTGNSGLSKKYLQISRGEGLYNLARADRLKKIPGKKGIRSADEMINFLRDYDFYGYRKFCGSMNATIVNERTLHTIIFDYTDSAVYFSSAQGYSALSRIVRYDFSNGGAVSYMDPAPEFESDELKGFLQWYCSFQDASIIGTVTEGISRRFSFVKFKEPDFSAVVKNSHTASCRNPRELWSLFRIWKRSRTAINPEDILRSCDKMIKRYPDLAILMIIRGNIEKSLRRYDDAVKTFERALRCGIISGYDKIHIYNDLVKLLGRSGKKEKALKYAVKNIELVDSLTEIYSSGDITGRIYKKMKMHVEKSD